MCFAKRITVATLQTETSAAATSTPLLCSVLEKSHIGAKSDFEIWGFKGFFFFGPKKGPNEGLQVATPENLK